MKVKNYLNTLNTILTFLFVGVKWAKHALEMYPGNCNAHKWFAICSGARGQLGSNKEKIEGGYIFQNHINEAIKINNRDPTLYYLKGKLEYEVYLLLITFEFDIFSLLNDV